MTTMIAACLAFAVAIPHLGGPMVVLVILALIRTFAECRRFQCDGRTLYVGDKLMSFLVSLGYTFVSILCAFIALALLLFAATALGDAAYWIVDAGDAMIVLIVMPILSVILAVAVSGAAAVTFFLFYWQTISPRLTRDGSVLPSNQHRK